MEEEDFENIEVNAILALVIMMMNKTMKVMGRAVQSLKEGGISNVSLATGSMTPSQNCEVR